METLMLLFVENRFIKDSNYEFGKMVGKFSNALYKCAKLI